MKILFICKYNRFRSKVAEFYFNKLNKKYKAKSAGLIKVDKPLTSGEKQRNKYLNEKYKIKFDIKSREITASKLEKNDKIIIVADDIPKKIFDHKNWKDKIIFCKVPDEPEANKRNIDKSVKIILNKIKKLLSKNEN